MEEIVKQIGSELLINEEDIYEPMEINEEQIKTFVSYDDRKIAIISVAFNVYRLQSSAGKLPLLDKFIKSKFLFAYNEDNNLCFFAAVASLKARIKPNIKFNHNHATQQARKLYKEYFNIDDRSIVGKESELTKSIKNFKGVVLEMELMKPICDHFKINLMIYKYDNKTGNYSLDRTFDYENEYDLHILEYIGQVEGKQFSHVMHILDHEKLTGIMICPKCKLYCKRKDQSHSNQLMNEHIEKCDGKRNKKVKLDKIPKPYVPHITKNKGLMYLIANGMIDKWFPKRYYITFDCETVKSLTEVKTKKTEISGILHLLSIACCVKLPSENLTKYYDIRTPHFMKHFMDYLFEIGEQVYEANYNEHIPEELQDRLVPVLGFNSKKFDINMILDQIVIYGYDVSRIVGSSSCFKQIIVKKKKSNVKLSFIDASSFVAGGTLKDFNKNFGSNKIDLSKGIFPYEAFTLDNYNQILSKTEPFTYDDFYSTLNLKNITEGEYKTYLEDCKNFNNR
jgi:hypothetical protein